MLNKLIASKHNLHNNKIACDYDDTEINPIESNLKLTPSRYKLTQQQIKGCNNKTYAF